MLVIFKTQNKQIGIFFILVNGLFLILSTLLWSSCTTNEKNNDVQILKDTPNKPQQGQDTINKKVEWADYFIIDYIDHNSDRLKEVRGFPISYMSNITIRDGRKYAEIKIGHSFDERYVTEQIIFIDSISKKIYEYDTVNDTLVLWSKFKKIKSSKNEIPPNGTYLFDVAFAEWRGESMGVKVTIIIKGDSIKVVYEGEGSLTAEIGEVIDEGIIMKHKSGKWIIGKNKTDTEIDDIGGCTDGPAIIDFKNKKYWLC